MADQQIAPNTTGQPAQPPAPAKTKVDMLAEIKKLLVKNNMTIDDNTLLALVEKIQVQGMSMKARIELLELQMLQPVEDAQEITILPRGQHYVVTKNFEGWLDFNDKMFKDILSNYQNKELSTPYIDKEHERAESYGDLIDPRITPEGLKAKIKLNKFGIELVKERAYKYISPTITNHKDLKGNPITNWLATISLVNSPALLGAMPALQEQLSLKLNEIKKQERVKNMDNILFQNTMKKITELSAKFDNPIILQGEPTPEAVMAIFPDIVKMIEELSKKVAELTGAKDAAEKDAATAKDAANAANQQVTAMKAEQTKNECDLVIKNAIECGIFIPNEKYIELKKKEFNENPQKIKDEIATLKLAMNIDENSKETKQFTTSFVSINEFSSEDLAIAKSSGYDLSKSEDKAKFLEMKREDK